MAKRKVKLYGMNQQGFCTVEDLATIGAIVGKNLYWPDGTLVSEGDLETAIAVSSEAATAEETGVGVITPVNILWSFILNVPQWIKNLAALASDPSKWLPVKNSIASGETLTIDAGYQIIVYDSFDIVGTLNLNGDLVIL